MYCILFCTRNTMHSCMTPETLTEAIIYFLNTTIPGIRLLRLQAHPPYNVLLDNSTVNDDHQPHVRVSCSKKKTVKGRRLCCQMLLSGQHAIVLQIRSLRSNTCVSPVSVVSIKYDPFVQESGARMRMED